MPGTRARGASERSSLWRRFAGLPLVVEDVTFERMSAPRGPLEERVTTQVRLTGGGFDGLGEDVSPLGDDRTALHVNGPGLMLAGNWTLGSLSRHLSRLDQWPSPPAWPAARRWRHWAFEAAALDLCLRQAGASLFDLLDVRPRPVRFINSLSLGNRPTLEPVLARLRQYPDLRFKVDVTQAWTADFAEQLFALDRVEILDFKGRYGEASRKQPTLRRLYERVISAFPHVLIEDPHDDGDVILLLKDRRCRVCYDARIGSFRDLMKMRIRPTGVNIKPCRFGTLRRLCDFYDACRSRDNLLLYGGGMDELGVGRGQLQLLASAFHPRGPNDIAPSSYNLTDLDEGLPASPLGISTQRVGFRRL